MTSESESAAGGHSCLYVGEVQHHRIVPFDYQFRYRVFLVYLDLAELDEVFRGRWLWSTNRLALARFRRDDHLGDPACLLSEAVADLVEERIGYRPAGPIRLLTHLRYFGYIINPVSFYYCYNKAGTQIDAVVAEVNNTPWGERHCYVLDWRGFANTESLQAEVQKEFHVSPFLPMEMQYRWQLSVPKESLTVLIENRQNKERQFSARMTLSRRQITTMNLLGTLLRHPFMTGKVVAAIYWQALKLWWRGVQYFPHPRTSSSV